jgi:hypothetical protein
MTSHKLLKINVITDRGDGVPPRPHPGCSHASWAWPVQYRRPTRYRRAARKFSRLALVEDTLCVNPHRMGRDHPTMQDTAFKQSLADGTEVCGTRRQVLDLGAYFVRHGRNPIILRLE